MPNKQRGWQLFPLSLGGLFPIATAVSDALILLDSEALGETAADSSQKISAFLSVTGMALGCVVALMWNLRLLGSSVAFRAASGISTFFAALFLLETGRDVAEQLDRSYGHYYFEQALFVSVPLLVSSIVLLTLSFQKTKAVLVQLLIFGGYLTATIVIQFSLLRGNFADQDLEIWNLNSLLVGLALAIWLCVWGAKEFRHN
jgi:GAF domain-containing protein